MNNLKLKINKLGLDFYLTRNEKSYNEIYEISKPLFKAILFKYYSANDAVAEDAVNEGFLLIWKYIDTFKQEYSFYNWMNTIITNSYLHYIIKNKKYKRIKNIEQCYDKMSYSLSYEKNNDDEEKMYNIMLEAIYAFEYTFKELLIDKLINEIPNTELQKKYNMNQDEVKRRIFYGKNKLRKYLLKNNRFAREYKENLKY